MRPSLEMSPKPPAYLGVWQEAEPGKQQHDLITWPSSGDGSRRCNPEAAAHPSPLLQSQRDDILGLIIQLSAESITSSSRQKSSQYLLIYPWLRIPPAIQKLSELPPNFRRSLALATALPLMWFSTCDSLAASCFCKELGPLKDLHCIRCKFQWYCSTSLTLLSLLRVAKTGYKDDSSVYLIVSKSRHDVTYNESRK